MTKRLFALLLCLALVVSLVGCGGGKESDTDVSSAPNSINPISNTDITTTDTVQSDEKVYCDATLEDDFVDDCVVIVINKEYTHKRIDFTPSHFPGVKISSIRSVMSLSKPSNPCPEEADRKNAANENFREIIEIKLQERGKQNVLDAIKELEKLPFVVSAEPNRYLPFTE